MSVAKVTEISADAPGGFEDAIQEGLTRASQTLKNITQAWVAEQHVVVRDGKVAAYRVHLKVTFVLES